MPRKKQWKEWQVTDRRIEPLSRGREADARVLQLLDRPDRELMAVWAAGQVTIASLARVMNCHAGTITRRLRRLRTRLNDPAAQMIARYGGELSTTRRRIAVRVFVRGEMPGRVARAEGMDLREVRLMLAEIIGWVRAHQARESEVNHAA